MLKTLLSGSSKQHLGELWHKPKGILFAFLFISFAFLQATTVGDIITNQATASYQNATGTQSVTSNEVNTTINGTRPTIAFLKLDTANATTMLLGQSSYYTSSGTLQPLESPTLPDGTTLSTTTPLGFSQTAEYKNNDIAIIKLQDLDRNIDHTTRDIVTVTLTSPSGDTETITLIETTPNSGIFTGYMPITSTSSATNDGKLYIQANEKITVAYEDQTTITVDTTATITSSDPSDIWVEKNVNVKAASIGDVVKYTILVHNNSSTNSNEVIWFDNLPQGVKYKPNTLKIDGVQRQGLLSQDGKTLGYTIPSIEAKGYVEITFLAIVGAVDKTKIVTNSTYATNENKKSNIATASFTLTDELYTQKSIIIGQVYEAPFANDRKNHGVANVRLYLEDGQYVLTDENGKYHLEGVANTTHVVQVDKAMLPAGYTMATCDKDARNSQSNYSKFTNLSFGGLKRVDFCLQKDQNSTQPTTDNNPPKDTIPPIIQNDKLPSYNSSDLQSTQTEILWPPKEFVPSIPSANLAIRYPKEQKAQLWLNGRQVSMLNYDGKITTANDTMVIDKYKGVDLLGGTNLFEFKIFDKNGNQISSLTRTIGVANSPVKMVFMPNLSKVVADGINPCVLAIRMVDSANNPIRAGVTGNFSVNAPYKSLENIEQLRNNPLAKLQQSTKYTVGKDGVAYIYLQPTTSSGEVTLHFPLGFKDEILKAWLKPGMRDWIMVGFGEGSIGYDTLKSKTTNNGKKETIQEGQLSFFAKGAISGKWLATIAYNSDKDTKEKNYFNQINPNAYYSVYNDNSQQNSEAPSTKKLYVKLEKDEFNILFGDLNTNLTTTELTQYSRTLTGLKSEYHGENIVSNIFASNSDQVAKREEIRGDGTSGFYYLKSSPVIENSESITIEIRDRYRNEITLSKQELVRYRDYDIDYALGRVYFKEPIFSNDTNFNPQYIVVNYEINGDGTKHYTYGGRVGVKSSDDSKEVGVTYINEDLGSQKNRLLGVDTQIELTQNTTLKAEYATSQNSFNGQSVKGSAKYAQLEHLDDSFYLRGYFREQDNSFGLGQLSPALSATRKMGLDGTKKIDDRTSLTFSTYRDSDLETDTNEDVLESKLQITQTLWGLYLGYRYAKNSNTDAANQILLGGNVALFDGRLRLLGAYEKSLGTNKDTLFPTRTMVGANIALTPSAEIFGSYEWLDSNGNTSQQGRVGTRYTPWGGMSLTSSVLSEFDNDTTRLYNTTGATQSFQLSPNIWLSAGYERGINMKGNITKQSDKYDSYILGGSYRGGNYSVVLNGEYRDGNIVDKHNLNFGIYTQPNDSVGLAFNTLYNKTTDDKTDTTSLTSALSFVYRPQQSAWILLDKLQYNYENDRTQEYKSEKLINNFLANYMPNNDLEVSLQYGLKYVLSGIDEFEYDGFVNFAGADITYDINDDFDIGLQGSTLIANIANNANYGAGVYLGYNIFENGWLNIGYNIKGFRDSDFNLQTYRHQGPFIRLRMKFDQESVEKSLKVLK